MLEICLIHAEVIGGDVDNVDLRLNALRVDHGPWYVFAGTRGLDYWILMGEWEHPVSVITLTREWAMLQAKWAVLYGDPWNVVYDDLPDAAARHVHAIEALGPRMAERIDVVKLEDILRWRRELEREPPTRGEVIREHITGEPIVVARN